MDLSPEFFQFIDANAGCDVGSLRLKYAGKSLPFDVEFAIVQIEARRKAAGKIPELLSHYRLLFPSAVAAEQCTCQEIASFHSQLVEPGSRVMDMTCGLGIDSLYMSRRSAEILTFDISAIHAATARENFARMGACNISLRQGDSIDWLERNPHERFDLIFVDPARRDTTNRRLFAMSDCLPDIPANISLLRRHTERLLVKVSPMLDIRQVCREIPSVSRIWAVSRRNECKELLLECDLSPEAKPSAEVLAIQCGHTDASPTPLLSYNLSEALPDEMIFSGNAKSLVGAYLYEPDVAVIKSGGASIPAREYGLEKLHPNTMLYAGKECKLSFSGKVFRINAILSSRGLGNLRRQRRNVVCRNHPLSARQLASRAGILEGSESKYLIGAGMAGGRPAIFDCELCPEL